MKIKIHNSLALKRKNSSFRWIHFLFNDIYLEYYPFSEEFYFWTKISNKYIGSLQENGSLQEFDYITLIPLDLKTIKSHKWNNLD